ncbi:cobalt-precorrin-5B (C(1))-methyltransferase CbiD [Paucidesulfovibrio longus]|uniref:cobalt-precorrin-5B (C(1))-methyltransferase CbiD n=1 Tax=Paucidesulfovibrio longus TaxID=889 RepID=UPI0003B505AD|nr:cobalt-precorrin-5B (C(1))-methyltransferase CbiD [Paucidesulfovibrio longus]
MSGLRQGFTTGTAAAAAAKAALLLLLEGRNVPEVDTPLPRSAAVSGDCRPEARLRVPIARGHLEDGGARAVVIKDAGDDPDVTHGAEIHALAHFFPAETPLRVELDGGRGVGRATLPGLAAAVGEAAINPGPREQIESAAREALGDRSGVARVRIEVPEGERLAAKTLNPRLGIVGGISILGSHGIVRPFSHDAWAASVTQALSVARAEGRDMAVFTTGRKSERLYLDLYPDTPERCLVQAADFFGHACRTASEKGFRRIGWSLFFGKLVKQAQGFDNTHARQAEIDFSLLAHWCAEAGAPPELARATAAANTARQVLGLLQSAGEDAALQTLLRALTARAGAEVRRRAPKAEPHFAVFDFNGSVLLATGRD